MASTPTPEALEVRRKGRRRLIGAFAIVIAMVVFLPMVLDPVPRQEKQDLSLAIPAKDAVAPLPPPSEKSAGRDESRTPPAIEPAKVVADTSKAAPEAPKAAPDVPKAAPEAPKAAARAEAQKPAAAPVKVEAAPKAAEAPRMEGFAVQIGAFKDDARLKQARDKLVAAKVKHYTERLSTPSGELTRLRAGPYPTREAADKVAAQLKRSGVEGKVVPLP